MAASDATVSRYVLFSGRFRREFRLIGLAAITASIITDRPSPSLHGEGLVVLITLVVGVATNALTVFDPCRRPLVRTTTGAVSCGILAGVDPGGATGFLLAFAGLDAGASLELGTGAYITGLSIVVQILTTVIIGSNVTDGFLGFAALAGFALATSLGQFRLRAEQAELRLAAVERAEQERTRAVQLAERAAAAREIHDILAHHLGALVIQLDTVNVLLDRDDPDLSGVRPVLHQAHQLAVDGLAEARQAVSSLREDTAPVEVSLRQIVESSATEATLVISGAPRPLPADVALAIRRTTQEALTNAAKHAPGAAPDVHLDFGSSGIHLTITDSGRPEGVAPIPLASTGGGYGLEGLRERSELLGGWLTAGPLDHGWQVALDIPDRSPDRSAQAEAR